LRSQLRAVSGPAVYTYSLNVQNNVIVHNRPQSMLQYSTCHHVTTILLTYRQNYQVASVYHVGMDNAS